MESVFRPSTKLEQELALDIRENGIEHFGRKNGDSLVEGHYLAPAKLPPEWTELVNKPLPHKVLAIAVDIYGTLLASAAGEIGSGAIAFPDEQEQKSEDKEASEKQADKKPPVTFPADMADKLKSIIEADHAIQKKKGIQWPEVNAPDVFARALGMSPDDGARACVAWECSTNRCAPMPGALAFLECIRDTGLPLGIVSNAQFYTPIFIKEAFSLPLFPGQEGGGLGFDMELCLWSYETGRAKPDPWMFAELAGRLEKRAIAASNILFIGNDALNDVAAAKEAGLLTALFAGDARSFKARSGNNRVTAAQPDTLLLSWDDARRLICT